MNIFVEAFDGDFAVCRLPDKDKNLIKLPIKALPKGVKVLDVITLRDNGSMYINPYAKEVRMAEICNNLNYKRFNFNFIK